MNASCLIFKDIGETISSGITLSHIQSSTLGTKEERGIGTYSTLKRE